MLFYDVWSETAALFERLMEIHSNPPILHVYHDFNGNLYHLHPRNEWSILHPYRLQQQQQPLTTTQPSTAQTPPAQTQRQLRSPHHLQHPATPTRKHPATPTRKHPPSHNVAVGELHNEWQQAPFPSVVTSWCKAAQSAEKCGQEQKF